MGGDSGAAPSAEPRTLAERINEIYLDASACAELAGLRYVSDTEPGLRRVRRGRGFSYVDAAGRPVAQEVRARLAGLAVPPAWREVWLCADATGHLLATGIDDRGRKQYLYNDRWREVREAINFSRLLPFADQLPAVRRTVESQLRRRSVDRERVLAAMVRIIDTTAIRIGNEVYAEENESFGLTTLTPKHVRVTGSQVSMCFPAKSGRQAQVSFRDASVARVVAALLERRGRRVFTLKGTVIDSDAVNSALAEWTGTHVTAKDFRTWHGTRVAYESLEKALPIDNPERAIIEAVDSAAEWLGNTRAVARSSYVHPQLLASVADGTFEQLRSARTPRGPVGLTGAERRLRSFLAAAWVDLDLLPRAA